MNIESIKDLITILENIGEPKPFHTRFFRGHSNKLYELKPTIYRNEKFIENEDNIIKDAIISNPDEYYHYSEGLFGILSKLQHYGYPTRLLDFTTNALVALYFAVASSKENDGELLILDIPNENIKYYDSDIVSILSAISLRNSGFDLDQIVTTDKFNDIKVELAIKSCEEAEKVKKYRNKILKIDGSLDLKGYISRYVANNSEYDSKDMFNNYKEMLKLIHDIRREKPAFRADINYKDMEKVICVKPTLNNQRIVRQQGVFLLFGIKGSKKVMSDIPDTWKSLGKESDSKKFYIPKDNKIKILKELNTFGINKKFLFPEIEKQAEEIKLFYGGMDYANKN
ncbi:FRG domain-containing protein [Rodentibacter myodis]|uniref:FRG domain-containing protein n=1 Tax=Rodentibacter myodis TaxID=1907939 RepID=A0A1V3JQ83_9PAST|nr:FRG domain-containing protein [Rodentibacter myodis]OOF58962.1 hypothetical protein BKL49_05325 [Rodentibacter myodis]